MKVVSPASLERRVLMLLAAADAKRLGKVLRDAGYVGVLCDDLRGLCDQMRAETAAAAVLGEETLTEADLAEMRKALEEAPVWSDLPLVLVRAESGPASASNVTRASLASLGPVQSLEQPLDVQELLSAVKSAWRRRERQFQLRDLLQQQQEAVTQVTEANGSLEQRIKESAASLRQVREQMEEFTYSVSHDLRAPLRAIRGFAQALVEDYAGNLDPTAREYLERVGEGAARLDSLLQDVLRYSRIGRSALTLKAVDAKACVAQALRKFEAEVTQTSATIEIRDSLPVVWGDEAMLVEILTHLLSNALKFVKPGQTPRLEIWGTQTKEAGRVWVGDHGIGLAPAHYERIFRVFERLHGTEAYAGNGMGLALVAKGTARLGGRVGVHATPGQGSQFWIELPLPGGAKAVAG